jgi:hypothetical protein
MDRLTPRSELPVKTICFFAAIGAVFGGADGAATGGFEDAAVYAIAGGVIGGITGLFASD